MKNYMNMSEIRREYEVSHAVAKKIFELASKIDQRELGEYRIFTNKVRASVVDTVINNPIMLMKG